MADSTTIQTLTKTFNSHSGCDIKATFAGIKVGELQGISITVSREKAPIYVMGRKDPVGFSRGKRGIAGSLVFAIFDRSALLHALRHAANYDARFWTCKDEIEFSEQVADSHLVAGGRLNSDPGQISLTGNTDSIFDNYSLAPAWYLDQLPPFEIVVNAVNEYGNSTAMKIYNVELLNNGTGMSIDDIMLDETMTFTCTHALPFRNGTRLDVPGNSIASGAGAFSQ